MIRGSPAFAQLPSCRRTRGTQQTRLQAVHDTLPTTIAFSAFTTGTAAFLLPKIAVHLKPTKCSACFGAGYNPCAICHGRGKVGGCFPEAPPLRACDTCQRKGRVRCQRCGGQGFSGTFAWLWRPAKNPGWGPRGE